MRNFNRVTDGDEVCLPHNLGSLRYLLLDRDGTLIEERHYLSDPDQVELIPGVIDGLRCFSEMGFGFVVITNQSGIGRGFFEPTQLLQVHERLEQLLAEGGIQLTGIYYCPHTPKDKCTCRKPGLGLVEMAAGDLGFVPEEALVFGDKACDIELGEHMGATTFLVRTGYGAEVETEGAVQPNYVVDSVREAVPIVTGLLAESQAADLLMKRRGLNQENRLLNTWRLTNAVGP